MLSQIAHLVRNLILLLLHRPLIILRDSQFEFCDPIILKRGSAWNRKAFPGHARVSSPLSFSHGCSASPPTEALSSLLPQSWCRSFRLFQNKKSKCWIGNRWFLPIRGTPYVHSLMHRPRCSCILRPVPVRVPFRYSSCCCTALRICPFRFQIIFGSHDRRSWPCPSILPRGRCVITAQSQSHWPRSDCTSL